MKVKRFQMGGEAPAAAPQAGAAPAEAGAQDGSPEEQIAQMAAQVIQQMGPEAATMLAQTIMQLLQSAQQGGGGGQEAPQGEPTYARKGGKLVLIGRR